MPIFDLAPVLRNTPLVRVLHTVLGARLGMARGFKHQNGVLSNPGRSRIIHQAFSNGGSVGVRPRACFL